MNVLALFGVPTACAGSRSLRVARNPTVAPGTKRTAARSKIDGGLRPKGRYEDSLPGYQRHCPRHSLAPYRVGISARGAPEACSRVASGSRGVGPVFDVGSSGRQWQTCWVSCALGLFSSLWFRACVIVPARGGSPSIGVFALVLQTASDRWRIKAGCYSTPSVVGLFTWVGAVELMFLHHAVQTRTRLQDRHLRTAVYRSVVPAFLWTPVAWSLVDWLRALPPDHDPPMIGTVQHYISWAALILFPLAAAVGLRAAATKRGKPSF